MTSPWSAITPEQEQDALGNISNMLVGTQQLVDEPGVVYALAAQNAQPQDAQAIDQFMQGLDAEKQVRLASATGSKITLSSGQKTQLDTLGVDYSGVEFTQQDAVNAAANQIATASNGAEQAKRNADGTYALDGDGNLITEKVNPKSSSGLFAGIFHDLNNDLFKPVERDVLDPVGTVSSKGYNFVSSAVQPDNPLHPGPFPGLQASNSRYQDMQNQGYDPTSVWSMLAFDASGKAHQDLTPLVNQFDQQNPNGLYGFDGDAAVAAATELLSNPKGYEKSIIDDPSLTPAQAAAKLKALSSPQFIDLARKVNAQSSSVGNALANAIGIDPVKHPTEYALTAAGTNLAASFAIDPTIIATKAVQTARMSAIGIDSLGDADRAAKILDPTVSTGLNATRLQGRYTNFIDLTHEMGDAQSAGDTVRAASLTARIGAQYPDLAPLIPDVLGTNQIVDVDKATGAVIYGAGAPINDLTDMAEYVKSKFGLTRLMNGRAAVQASLMPGASSLYGFRKLKGLTAGWMTARSATRSDKIYQSVADAANADPALAGKLIDSGELTRLLPSADDAVDSFSGADLTPLGRGNALAKVKVTGSPLGGVRVGWGGPTAIAARARIAAQRLTTLLPRNTMIDINDAASSDKIYKYAMTYLNRGDAHALQAAWNMGDGGQRKAIIGAMLDQVGHAAGLGKTASGTTILNSAKTTVEDYSAVGDNVVKDGQTLALYPGQSRSVWVLPTFKDLHHAAAKVGLWESTMGRALTSRQADLLMSQWKLGAIGKPSTVTRNMLEGWLRTGLDGGFGDAVKSKAVLSTPNKELWARGLAPDTKATFDRLVAGGKTDEAEQLARSSTLTGEALGRSAPSERLSQFAPFALAGRSYRRLFGSFMDSREAEAIANLGPDELTQILHEYSSQIREAALGMRQGANEATDAAKAGWGPARLKYAIHKARQESAPRAKVSGSWTQQDTDGTVGADRYANALAQRVNPSPSIAKAVIEHIEQPDKFGLDHVLNALDDPAVASKMHQLGYNHLTWDTADGTGPARTAVDEDEKLAGNVQWANKLVNDMRHMVTGQNGVVQSKLTDFVKTTGTAPDADWIGKYLTGDSRPESVLAPETVAMPNGGVAGLAQTLQDIEGGAFEWMVDRPLHRGTSAPVFMANYAKARVGLDPMVDQLVEQGVSRAGAENLAKELSIKNAWVKTENLIDDPGQKTQFDVIARNMFPFSRATTAMVRRWGSGLWQNPVAARKMMLTYEAAQHTGLIYDNEYGEPTFTYPGSGVLNMVLREVAKVPGFENIAQYPVSASMTGGVLMSVPGADNPFRMSMGPMLSIPMREVFKLFPDQRGTLDEVDSFINGPIGVGQTFSQLEPTLVSRFYTAMNDNERNSVLASSMVGAIANLAAAGQIPPAGASPSERDAFIQNVKTQVRSQLFLRAIFGLVAPAAPSAPSDGTPASQADYAFKITGLGQLSDEYKTILNDTGGDLARASAIWTALHPDKTVYEVSGSEADASKVSLPATTAALNWMTANSGFVGQYKSVAAYFLPESTGDQPFDDQAYKTQIELGLREKKTPTEFYDDVRVRNAESVYYPSVDQFDALIAKAQASGDTGQAKTLTAQKSSWEQDFKNLNPLFAAKIDAYPAARATAIGQLADLRKMVTSGDVPDGEAGPLSQLLSAYDGYTSFVQAHKGDDKDSTLLRSQALKMFNSWATQNLTGGPLADLYAGVFRTLNTNLVDIDPADAGGS